MDWTQIDDCGFNHDSVKKLSLDQFIEQYKDQRGFGVSEIAWIDFLKSVYEKIVPAKPAKNEKIKPEDSSL